MYESPPYRTAASGQLRIFRGYDLRTIYLWKERHPVFGLIVDICWEIQDADGQRLGTATIAQHNAMAEVAHRSKMNIYPAIGLTPRSLDLGCKTTFCHSCVRTGSFRCP